MLKAKDYEPGPERKTSNPPAADGSVRPLLPAGCGGGRLLSGACSAWIRMRPSTAVNRAGQSDPARWEMHVVPAPMMGRLMVALFPVLETDKLWLHGCCLRYGQAKARLWMKPGTDNRIFASVGSPPGDAGSQQRNELLQMIRLALWRIADEYQHLQSREEWEWEINGVRDFISCAVLERLPESLVPAEVVQILRRAVMSG